jgi:hypothetical protein
MGINSLHFNGCYLKASPMAILIVLFFLHLCEVLSKNLNIAYIGWEHSSSGKLTTLILSMLINNSEKLWFIEWKAVNLCILRSNHKQCLP